MIKPLITRLSASRATKYRNCPSGAYASRKEARRAAHLRLIRLYRQCLRANRRWGHKGGAYQRIHHQTKTHATRPQHSNSRNLNKPTYPFNPINPCSIKQTTMSEKFEINLFVKRLHPNAVIPTYAHPSLRFLSHARLAIRQRQRQRAWLLRGLQERI